MVYQIKDVLKQLRKQKDYTQEEIAKKINISQRAYSYYETGRSTPDMNTLIKLADFFEVSLDVLTGRYIKVFSDNNISIKNNIVNGEINIQNRN